MQKAFYYLRSLSEMGRIHPYACVCVVKSSTGKIARGVAVCSPNDHFTKQIGRNKAYGYALKALNNNEEVKKHLSFAGQINREIFHMVGKNGIQIPDSRKEIMNSREYAQSSVLENPGCNEVHPDIPLTEFEKSLLDD